MTDSAAVDTNAVIQLLNRSLHPRVLGFDEILVPKIVVGELLFGAHNSDRVEDNRRRVFSFLNRVSLLDIDTEIADLYGRIKAQLRRNGKPIPQNDVWIAATAMRHGLPLVTDDQHFERIEGLITIPWQRPA